MAIIGSYHRFALIDCTNSGFHAETFESREAVLIGLLWQADPVELERLRVQLIPAIQAEHAADAAREREGEDEKEPTT